MSNKFIIVTNKIFNNGNRTTKMTTFTTLTEAKNFAYNELASVSKEIEVVKVVILDNNLHTIFHEINGTSIFDIQLPK